MRRREHTEEGKRRGAGEDSQVPRDQGGEKAADNNLATRRVQRDHVTFAAPGEAGWDAAIIISGVGMRGVDEGAPVKRSPSKCQAVEWGDV